jgi:hypothetical protein
VNRLSIRAYGILLAGAIAIITALLAQMVLALGSVLTSGFNLQFVAYCVLASGLAAALMSNRVSRSSRSPISDILTMTIATFIIAILLFPIVLAVWTRPTVESGGEVQCVSRGLSACPHGLSGDAAMSAQDDAMIAYYRMTPLAFVVLLPAAIGLLVPSAVWVVLMRHRTSNDSGAYLYHRLR